MSDQGIQLRDEVDFTIIRYAQCWEDADVLLEALDIQPGDVCVSIASAGDNTLSMLSRDPSKIIAVDLSASQLACLELRVAAYRHLTHAELLELIGARPSPRRIELYQRLAPDLSDESRRIWDANRAGIEIGIGMAGRFEQYLDQLRRYASNPAHSRPVRHALFDRRGVAARRRFYERHWNNRRWRLLIRLLCSRLVMGRLGRDPRFFKYAEGSVSDHILGMVEHAMVDLDPADNPYLYWILNGTYGSVLPHALREENFEPIRRNLDRLEWQQTDVQGCLAAAPNRSIHRFNLSDVFEYVSTEESEQLFREVVRTGVAGGRLAYWNMLVPRHRPESLRDRIWAMPAESADLHAAAKTFFYTDFVVEELA